MYKNTFSLIIQHLRRGDVAELLGDFLFLLCLPPLSCENESNLSSICSVGSPRAASITMALWNKAPFPFA